MHALLHAAREASHGAPQAAEGEGELSAASERAAPKHIRTDGRSTHPSYQSEHPHRPDFIPDTNADGASARRARRWRCAA